MPARTAAFACRTICAAGMGSSYATTAAAAYSTPLQRGTALHVTAVGLDLLGFFVTSTPTVHQLMVHGTIGRSSVP